MVKDFARTALLAEVEIVATCYGDDFGACSNGNLYGVGSSRRAAAPDDDNLVLSDSMVPSDDLVSIRVGHICQSNTKIFASAVKPCCLVACHVVICSSILRALISTWFTVDSPQPTRRSFHTSREKDTGR